VITALFLACTGEESLDSGTGPVTSEERAEISGAVVNQCEGDELELQIGFVSEVSRVEADVTSDGTVHELHDVPFAGMDEDTESIFIHEVVLETGASEASLGSTTTFTCADSPVAAFRIFDNEGAIMGCYIGEFVVDYYDATGCPIDE
jgi:hypothetical protein